MRSLLLPIVLLCAAFLVCRGAIALYSPTSDDAHVDNPPSPPSLNLSLNWTYAPPPVFREGGWGWREGT